MSLPENIFTKIDIIQTRKEAEQVLSFLQMIFDSRQKAVNLIKAGENQLTLLHSELSVALKANDTTSLKDVLIKIDTFMATLGDDLKKEISRALP